MSSDDLREHQQFSMKIEQAVRMTNRQVLHPIVDPLTEDKVLSVALGVAKRRAAYIGATLKMGTDGPHQPSGDELRTVSGVPCWGFGLDIAPISIGRRYPPSHPP